MQTPRFLHTMTLLPTGKVLVVGGIFDIQKQETSSAELYDPAIGTWIPTSSSNLPRQSATATLLSNGQVLVADRRNPPDLYDPATGTWQATAPMHTPTPRNFHTATLLPNGQVLVVGGFSPESIQAPAELFTPSDLPPTPTPTPVCTPMPIQGTYQGTTTQDTTGQHHTFTLQVAQPGQPGSSFSGTLTFSGVSSPLHLSGSITSQCKVTMSAANVQPAILISFTGTQDSTGKVSGRYSLTFAGSTNSGGFSMNPV